MKRILPLFIFLTIFLNLNLLNAQTYQWARSGGGASADLAESITMDGAGNTYITGTFGSTATFGTFNLVGGGSYIAKYDVSGNCLWAVRFDGDVADINGPYLTGSYMGTAVIGTTTLTSAGGTIDIFVAKFDQNTGAFTWAKSAGSAMDDDHGTGVSIDAGGFPVVTGYFWDQATFGTINVLGTNWEAFVARYDGTNGNCLWAVAAGGSNNQQSYDIRCMGNTVSYIVGYFSGTAVIGTTTLTANAGGQDIFVAKYDAAIPGWVWAKNIGGSNWDEGFGIDRVALTSDMYVTGNFQNTMTVGTTTLTSSGLSDAFVARIDQNGNWIWAKSGGSPTSYDYAYSVTGNNNGCAIGGKFQGNAVFGSSNITSAGQEDAFLAHYDANGNELWAVSGGGSTMDFCKSVISTSSGIVYGTGSYNGTGTFGPYNINAVSVQDAFLVKVCSIAANAGNDVSVCVGGSTNLNASGGGTYSWTPSSGLSATNISNPVATPTATTNYSVTVTNTLGCSASDVITVSVNPLPNINAGNDASVCAGQSTNLSAGGGNTYTWTPASTLSNANIANPVATPTATTNYTVNATDNNGCSNSDVVSITVNPSPNASAGPDVGICNGGMTLLGASGGISYSWSPSTGLSNPNIANPIASPTITTIYSVTVTNSLSCSATDAMTLTVYPLPVVTATANVSVICKGGTASLGAGGALLYAWSPSSGLSNPNSANTNATVNNSTTYTVSGTDGNSCSNTGTVTVMVYTITPDICMVTTDSESVNNILYWDKTLYAAADSFVVYRETSTNVYDRVGAVSMDSLSMFVDSNRLVGPANGDPNITTYRYKLQVRDTCGNYGPLGPYHTSIYFNDLLNGSFTWNTYTVEGMGSTPITTFELLRDSNNTGFWKVIGTAAGTANVLNDPQYSTFQFIANWRVQANGITCNPTQRQGADAAMGTIVKSKSNITNNRTTGIKNNVSGLSIYPNPFNSIITIEGAKGMEFVNVINLVGESVYSGVLRGEKSKIDMANYPAGVYYLKLSGSGGIKTEKIVKQ